MTNYKIEPRIKKRWFKKNELWYDLVRETTTDEWVDPSYGNGGGDFIPTTRVKTIFSSQNIEEIKTVIDNLKTT